MTLRGDVYAQRSNKKARDALVMRWLMMVEAKLRAVLEDADNRSCTLSHWSPF